MTSEEIKKEDEFMGDDERDAIRSACFWLREIAYQLALHNEQKKLDFLLASEPGDPR